MKQLIRYLLFPPVCAGCGQRFDIFAEETVPVFCLRCRAEWEESVQEICPDCGRGLFCCDCMPELMREAGVDRLQKLCRYHPDKHGTVSSRAILRMKDRNIPRVFRFFGERLWEGVRQELAQDTNVLVTYIPRSRAGKARAGFDQGQKLAMAVSTVSGKPMIPLFGRRGRGQQKKRTASERLESVRHTLRLKNGKEQLLSGKTILLIDDIVTTGADMALCAQLLAKAGAGRVIGAAVAVTFREDRADDA